MASAVSVVFYKKSRIWINSLEHSKYIVNFLLQILHENDFQLAKSDTASHHTLNFHNKIPSSR